MTTYQTLSEAEIETAILVGYYECVYWASFHDRAYDVWFDPDCGFVATPQGAPHDHDHILVCRNLDLSTYYPYELPEGTEEDCQAFVRAMTAGPLGYERENLQHVFNTAKRGEI